MRYEEGKKYVGPDGESTSCICSSDARLFEGCDPELEPIRCLGRWKD